jgi:hypothetical protein
MGGNFKRNASGGGVYAHSMTEYKVLSAGNPTDLAKKVNEALAENWQLAGGIATTWDGVAKNKLYQAMVR